MPEVYLIRNQITGKGYVGWTSRTARDRWRDHLSSVNKKYGCPRLSNSIRKHGSAAFTLRTLYRVETAEEAKKLEIRCIAKLGTKHPCGYNLTAGGDGMTNPTSETRRKMSEARKGSRRSVETRRKMSLAALGNTNALGTCPSPETRRKLSLIKQNQSLETRRKIGLAHKGKILSPETKQKLSLARRGKALSKETRRKIGLAHKGKRVSEETRLQMSLGAKRRWGTA